MREAPFVTDIMTFSSGSASKFMAKKRGLKTEMSRDHDFTDYDALRAFVLAFAARTNRQHANAW